MSEQPSGDDLIGGIHRQVAHLGWLVGQWRGIGKGSDPQGGQFKFEQVLEFAHDQRPFLEYRSISWILDEDENRLRPSHTEQGYFRGLPDNGVEAVIANASGYGEAWFGRAEVASIENAQITSAKLILEPSGLAKTPSATPIAITERMYGIRDGKLLMTFDMGVDKQPVESHIWLILERV